MADDHDDEEDGKEEPKAKQKEVFDPAEFWQPEDFDPVAYLNRALADTASNSPQNLTKDTKISWSYSSSSSLPPLTEISAQTQSILVKVNAQNVRFTSKLSNLTDEMVRGASRLAYEVEVLKSNAIALHEILTETLRDDIQDVTGVVPAVGDDNEDNTISKAAESTGPKAGSGTVIAEDRNKSESAEPEFIGQLKMLGRVKSRLEEVIAVFGEAMTWPLPLSELSITSSLISVSAPEAGLEAEQKKDQEEKAKAFAKETKAAITALLANKSNKDQQAAMAGLEAAAAKVEALRTLSMVWKSTAQEKARNKFVDGLAKLVEDGRRQLEARSQSQQRRKQGEDLDGRRPASTNVGGRGRSTDNKASGSGGLFRNLQRIRDEIYLE